MVVFDDVDLSIFMDIIEVKTTLISNRKNYTINIPSRHGEIYNDFKYDPKEIKIVGDIKCGTVKDYESTLNRLACVLNVNSERTLYIDSTNRFYYAVPVGDFDIDKITRGMGRVELNFICYIPFCFDTDAKQYEGAGFITCTNEGNEKCYPVLNIGLTKECNFVQIENTANRKKMLVGTIPLVSLPTVAEKTDVLEDECQNTTGWTTGTTSIDSNRSTGGTLGVTTEGDGIMCGDFGSGSATWHGVSARKNLGTSITDFTVEAFIINNSTGVGGDPSVGVDMTDPSYEKGTVTSGSRKEYYQVVCTALNVRTGPSTKYRKLRCLVKGNRIKPLEWKGSWARIGTNEWCCCNTAYVQKKYEDTTVVTTTSRTLENFHTTTKAEILRKANPKGFVECTVPSGTILRLESSKKYYEPEKVEDGQAPDAPGGNGDYYYKLAKSYNGYWGYVKVDNVKKANNVVYEYAEELETADDKTGVVEVYGYSANNEQLFKLSMVDDNEYYSFNYPDITVCGKSFLKDNNVAPAPKVSTENNGSDDKLTVKQEYILSGSYGSWNNFYGKVGITRKDNYYQAWVVKMKNGQVIKQLFSPTKKVSNATNSKLSYLTIYIGTSGDNAKASGMSVEHISVKNLNPSNPATQNIKKFQAGDVIKVDCFNNQVWLNDVIYNRFEIGSQFFPLELGDNVIKVASDDGEAQTTVIFNEQYL